MDAAEELKKIVASSDGINQRTIRSLKMNVISNKTTDNTKPINQEPWINAHEWSC